MMPLCTSATVPPQSVWGWAFFTFGAPCVAQRVWASAVVPAGSVAPSSFSSAAIFPAVLNTSMRPSLTTASPAESYPRYSSRFSPSSTSAAAGRAPV